MHKSEKKKDTCASKIIPIKLYTPLLCTTKNLNVIHKPSKKLLTMKSVKVFLTPSISAIRKAKYSTRQLGTFSVNGEWVWAVCSPLVAKFGPTGAEHVARSQLDRYVLFLIQSVIINLMRNPVSL